MCSGLSSLHTENRKWNIRTMKYYHHYRYLIILFIINLPMSSHGQVCPGGLPATFAKASSMIPKTVTQPVLMYASSRGTAITAECYNRCRGSTDCAGFIVDYERASCFRIPESKNTLNDMISAKNSNFFFKVCLQVPSNCTQKAWPVEFSPNMELVGYQQNVVPNVADKWQCAQLCLTGTTQFRYGSSSVCYSAQYQSWSKTCTISYENRRTKPEAFGPSLHRGTDYIENQCIAEPNEGVCWHEPVYNYTLTDIDLQIPNINIEQCRDKCIKEQYFNCRGYTHRCAGAVGQYSEPVCYLHSDDTLTEGPPIPAVCAVYVERLTCIDLKVDCNSNTMSIQLNYKGFSGRIFSLGHSEECSVTGHNEDATTFILPIPTDARALNKCGVFVAHSVGYGNRKMASAVIVVQRHPIIQTVGDRIIKVTCVAEDASDRIPRPLFNNITLDATFGVAEPDIQSSITSEGFGNVSSISPTARLKIVDISRGGTEASETILGEELELRVEIFPPFNVSVLRAGHLVASSGDGRESLLLLDWRGCPPDATAFPALIPKDDRTLYAIFKAFRFPSSPILRFSLILTICETVCQPTDCGNGLNSWGRRKRQTNEQLIKQEVPLQLTIIVRSPERNDTDEIESMAHQSEESDKEVICASWPMILTSMLILGLLHILILAGCCYILQSHHQKLSDQVSLHTDFQPRHVTWADQ